MSHDQAQDPQKRNEKETADYTDNPDVNVLADERVSVVENNGLVGADGRVPLPSVVRPLADRFAISVELATLFGWGDAGMYQQRNRMLDDLGRDLSVTEVDALMAFLYMQPHEVGLSEIDFNATGDKVMETIENQLSLNPDYTDHLVVIFYDQSYNEVWRNYCLQHMGSSYTPLG